MKLFGKSRGPGELPGSGLTGRQLTAIALAFALAIVLLPVGAAANAFISVFITDPTDTSHQARVDASGNLQVAGSVTVANAPKVQVAIPTGQFSEYVISTPWTVAGPDPAGTNYAITSVTFTNEGNAPAFGDLEALYGTTSDCETFSSQVRSVLGPVAQVLPGDTVHLDFPQPFVMNAASGANACLIAESGSAGVRGVVVGYRF
jgi:hypothetical protein